MPTQQEKLRAQGRFKRLKNHLRSQLGGKDKNRKIKIIEKVKRKSRRIKRKSRKKGKEEGIFVKLFLERVLRNYFIDDRIKVIMEGVNSNGRTRSKDKFFGSKPAVDFLFEKDNQPRLFESRRPLPFPLNTVGEVKYGKLTFRTFATGLGQIIGYLNASEKFNYGYYIFFNTDINKTITEKDEKFLDELWEKENIFVAII